MKKIYIGYQFAIVALISQMAILTLFGYFAFSSINANLAMKAKQNAQNHTFVLENAISKQLLGEDYNYIRYILKEELARDAIRYARLEDIDGNLIFEGGDIKDINYKIRSKNIDETLKSKHHYYKVVTSVSIGEENYGMLYFGISMKHLLDTKDSMIKHYISIWIFILFFSSYIFFRIGKSFKEKLAFVADEIESGEIKDRDDEFKHLGGKFNSIVGKERDAQDELKRHKDELEVIIKERTKELEKSLEIIQEMNRGLEDRVKEESSARINQQALLIQQSKLASMGEMIGAISHQWKQPLNTISIANSTISYAIEDSNLNREQIDKSCELIQNSIEYLNQTINDFKNFFKPNKEKKEFKVSSSIDEARRILSHKIRLAGVELKLESVDLVIYGVKNEMTQVLINLINNSLDAISEKKPQNRVVAISGRVDNEHIVIIELRDSGGGIPSYVLDRLFNPYVSTKGEKGTGIGLYMSKIIIEESFSGKIYAKNIDNGASFTIEIPRAFRS